MIKPLKYLSCVAAFSLTLAGCGGGGSVTPAAPGSPGGATTSQVTMRFSFNSQSSLAGVRHRNYVSMNTHGLGVSVVPHGSPTFSLPTTTAQMRAPMWATTIAPGFNGQGATCTNASAGSSYTCTIVLVMPVGYDDLQITTWDQTPAFQGYNASYGGATPPPSPTQAWPGANNLSFQIILNQLVEVNQNVTQNYTLSGVVSRVVLNLSPNSLVDGAASGTATNPVTPALTVRGIDADGNTIIGADPWVDANGVALSVQVAANPVPATSPSPGPAGPAGTVQLNDAATPATNGSCKALVANGGVLNPSQGNCVLTYDGGDLSSVNLVASTNSGLVGASVIQNATLSLTRTANGAFGVPGPPTIAAPYYTGSVSPNQLALGPDGRIWFGSSYTNAIGAITTSGTITNYALTARPQHIIASPDGDLWFTDTAGSLDRVAVDGTQSAVPALTYASAGITVGPDNKIWVTETNAVIAQYGWNGSGAPVLLNEFPQAAGTNHQSITSGPNGHLWAVKAVGAGADDTIDEISTAGVLLNSYTYTAGDNIASITTGADGNIWFTDATKKQAVRMTPGGAFTPVQLVSNPAQITPGPEGSIWVTEVLPDRIARIDTQTLALNEYGLGATSLNPLGIATGADNNIWFSESTGVPGPAIGKLTP